jgi:hypothetical protein
MPFYAVMDGGAARFLKIPWLQFDIKNYSASVFNISLMGIFAIFLPHNRFEKLAGVHGGQPVRVLY